MKDGRQKERLKKKGRLGKPREDSMRKWREKRKWMCGEKEGKRERREEQQEKAGVCMEDGGREISFKITG